MRHALVMAALAGVVAGCDDTSTFTCQASIPCGAAPVQTCCTLGHCEYRLVDRIVACQGTDCTAAAAQVRMLCPASCDDAGTDTGAALDASGCVR